MHKKKITVLTFKNKKKNSRYIYSNCSPTSEVHAALTLLFPAHLYSDHSISLKLPPAILSDLPYTSDTLHYLFLADNWSNFHLSISFHSAFLTNVARIFPPLQVVRWIAHLGISAQKIPIVQKKHLFSIPWCSILKKNN